ncbi:MAG: DUF2817 domain-containing protein [Gammaproteobacteria bacterium]|nr:DUF2817 domain-containing protein [Gammaproteobacteria bacterium]
MFKQSGVLVISLLLSLQVQAAQLKTQLELSGFQELTSYQRMMGYLGPLADSSANLKMEIIGTSVKGRSIPALFFSLDEEFASQREAKPLVLIFCQHHGDEPSGKEAALIVARRLLNEDTALLENLDLILVPQINPDGSESGQRRNANDMDLNRNHVILSEPEANAIHQLFLDWMPEVSLDVHEYNAVTDKWVKAGYLKDAEEMLGGVTNLNIDPTIIDFTRNTFIPETGAGIEEDGYRFNRYIVGSPFEGDVVRFSTTAINDGRQSTGIYNTLSFIFEGKRYGNLTGEIEKRTHGQVSAILNFLKTTGRHARTILETVRQARSNIDKQELSFIQMDYFADENRPVLDFPVFELANWTHTRKDLVNFKPVVKVKKSVRKPAAYSFDAGQKKLVELLQRHRLPLFRLTSEQQAEAETYLIKHVTDAMDEQKHTYIIDLEKTSATETLQAGTIIVPVEGPASNLIPLLLEPESTWGIVSTRAAGKERFADFLTEGRPYPVKRLVSIEQLDTEPLEQ